MKQLAQRPRDGRSVVEVPVPALRSGWLLVANHRLAYTLLTGQEAEARPFGVLLEYPGAGPATTAAPAPRGDTRAAAPSGTGVALIGAGAFARATLIPALKAADARLVAVAAVVRNPWAAASVLRSLPYRFSRRIAHVFSDERWNALRSIAREVPAPA